MSTIISIKQLSKIYASGSVALNNINLTIIKGEILALLGPNGAGKTTLISIICGLTNTSKGSIIVDGYNIIDGFRHTRKKIGLVPQELTLSAFDTVWDTINFSRGLFGKKPNTPYLQQLLKSLQLYDKKNHELRTLSGGMKRRVLIAKALAHEPTILFLDEPTAGVDVELRKDMWKIITKLSQTGVTIILTTHYIEEAETIADRIGIMNHGKLLLIDNKQALMDKLGKKALTVTLKKPINRIPKKLKKYALELSNEGLSITYTYNVKSTENQITNLLHAINTSGLELKDLRTTQSSLEDIFVDLLNKKP